MTSCVKTLLEHGLGSFPVKSEDQKVFKECFQLAAEVGLAKCDSSSGIDKDSDSANVTGVHAAGAMSAYNTCREGMVFSNGEMLHLDDDGNGEGERFATGMETFFATACGIAREVLADLERHMGLQPGWFEETLGNIEHQSQWHVKRYRPELAPEMALTSDGRKVLLPVHTDPSIISIVLHDLPGRQVGAQGLEFLQGPGQWAEVPYSGHAVANVLCGSVLERITGGLFPAVRHRVAGPPSPESVGRRVVATFFFRPSPNALLVSPPSRLLEGRHIGKPMRFRQWSQRVARNYERHVRRHKEKNEKKKLSINGEQGHNEEQEHEQEAIKTTTERRESEAGTGHGAFRLSRREQKALRRVERQYKVRPVPPEAAVTSPCGTWVQLMGKAELAGREKYLGGDCCADGRIFAIPGHARRVLCIHPQTGTVSHIGPEFEGQFKWLRSVKAVDGQGREAIYGLPCHASQVLKIIPSTNEVTTIGQLDDGLWKFHGGVERNGYIFCIPQKAERVLRIELATDKVELIGPVLPGICKWYGGILGHDDAIYGVPQNARSVLRIDTVTHHVTTFGDLPEGGHKWHGGLVGTDGAIYSFPAHADTVLKIVPGVGDDAHVEFIGHGSFTSGVHRADGKYKYLGGVLGKDGFLYGIPSDADHVLRIKPDTQECEEVGMSLRGETIVQNKWQNGFCASDGTIYGIPLKADRVLCVRPHHPDAKGHPEVTTVGGPFPGLNKWEGGVMGADGAMYCMPLNHKRVLRIGPSNLAPPPPPPPPPPPLPPSPSSSSSSSTTTTTTTTTTTAVAQTAVLRSSAHSATYAKGRRSQRPPSGVPLPSALTVPFNVPYNAQHHDVAGAVLELLKSGAKDLGMGTTPNRLEDVVLPPEALARPRDSPAAMSLTELVEKDAAFLGVVERLVRDVVAPHLKAQLVAASSSSGATGHAVDPNKPLRMFLQHPPTLRIQPGPSSFYVRTHSDSEYGHQPGELNFWLPLTDPELTLTTLWVESASGADDFSPLNVRPGEAAAFHGSACRHHVPANASSFTRVSIDFRIGIEGYYDPTWTMQGTISDHKRIELSV